MMEHLKLSFSLLFDFMPSFICLCKNIYGEERPIRGSAVFVKYWREGTFFGLGVT